MREVRKHTHTQKHRYKTCIWFISEEVWNNLLELWSNFFSSIDRCVCCQCFVFAGCKIPRKYTNYKCIIYEKKLHWMCSCVHFFFVASLDTFCSTTNSWSHIIYNKTWQIFLQHFNIMTISDLNEISCILLKYLLWKLSQEYESRYERLRASEYNVSVYAMFTQAKESSWNVSSFELHKMSSLIWWWWWKSQAIECGKHLG